MNNLSYEEKCKQIAMALMSGKTHEDIKILVHELGMSPKSENEIEDLVNIVLAENKEKVLEYKSGKTKMMESFIGLVMKKSGGTAKPVIVREILQKKLNE